MMISKLIRTKIPLVEFIQKPGYAPTVSRSFCAISRPLREDLDKGDTAESKNVRFANGIITSPLRKTVQIPNENVVEHVWKRADEWTNQPVTTCAVSGRTYTFGMMRTLISRCAQAMLSHCGMQPGEVVGILLPNIPEYLITLHGAHEAGLIATFVNPLYTPDEIKRQFEKAGAKMIVTFPLLTEVAVTIAQQLPDYRTTICIGCDDNPAQNVHGLQSLLLGSHKAELPGINPRETCLLPFSSGTTGLPKGVILSHQNLVANLVQVDIPELMDVVHEKTQEKILTVLPFFHIYGCNGIMNISIKHGFHMITLPKFTPEEYIKALVDYRPEFLFVVPSLLLFLSTHPAVKREHLTSLRSVTCGAAPLCPSTADMFKEKLGRDIVIRQGYGMTESSPISLFMPVETPQSKAGTVGVLIPGTEAKIVSLTTGETLGTREPGELLIRGPQVMNGYLNNEKATAETIDADGWLHTGDVAYYDEDRYFYVVDRCKELIKVKGNQVSPTELENILLGMSGIADAAVVGIPDSFAGELPRAYIVKKIEATITEEEILKYVNTKVIHYKKITSVKFVKLIPRNPNGKILRHQLKLK